MHCVTDCGGGGEKREKENHCVAAFAIAAFAIAAVCLPTTNDVK